MNGSVFTPNSHLQEALGCLDLDLEQELMRYRRRQGSDRPTPPPLEPPPAVVLGDLDISDLVVPDLPEMSPPEPIAPFTFSTTFGAISGNVFAAEPETEASLTDPEPGETVGGALVHQPQVALKEAEENVPPPEDFLASSEELLKTLNAQAEKRKKKRLWRRFWSHPLLWLGMAFVTGGTAAGVWLWRSPQRDLYRQKVAAIPGKVQRRLGSLVSSPPKMPQNSNQNGDRAIVAPPPSSATGLPTVPNLAATEFVEPSLDNLSTLSLGDRSGLPPLSVNNLPAIPSPNSTEAIPPANPSAPSPSLAQSLLPYVAPPAVPPLPQAGQNGKISETVQPNLFYVVVESADDASLQQAQQILKTAFVRQFPTGKLIQLGAFVEQKDAQALAGQFGASGLKLKILQFQTGTNPS